MNHSPFGRRAALAGLGVAAVVRPVAAAPSFIESLFAPSAKLWPRWQAHDPASTRLVDHSAWNVFLQRRVRRRVDGVMGVEYQAVTAEERGALRDYLDRLAAVPVSALARPEQYAFWVNLYNALTVRIVLDHPGKASIRDIALSGGLFDSGPWSTRVITVEAEALTLNDIEHRILRPIWRDPRTHYALNCASVGCPDLRATAYTAAGLAGALDAAAQAYVNHPRGVEAGPDGLTLSSIYNWFADDFGGEAGVLAHLRRYAAPALLAAIDRAPRVIGYRYDWTLNSVASAPR